MSRAAPYTEPILGRGWDEDHDLDETRPYRREVARMARAAMRIGDEATAAGMSVDDYLRVRDRVLADPSLVPADVLAADRARWAARTPVVVVYRPDAFPVAA